MAPANSCLRMVLSPGALGRYLVPPPAPGPANIGTGKTWFIEPGESATDEMLEAMVGAVPGDTIELRNNVLLLNGKAMAYESVDAQAYAREIYEDARAVVARGAVRLRTYQVQWPEVDAAYVETLYQWPAFKAWQQAGLEEISR